MKKHVLGGRHWPWNLKAPRPAARIIAEMKNPHTPRRTTRPVFLYR